MSDLVSPDDIEAIVGLPRHDTEHYARAVSADQAVYILHSRECKESMADLRDCQFSVALDRGIQHHIPWSGWRRVQDQPVRVEVFRGWLVPELAAVKAASPVPTQETKP
jgi:hypothetical protein